MLRATEFKAVEGQERLSEAANELYVQKMSSTNWKLKQIVWLSPILMAGTYWVKEGD